MFLAPRLHPLCSSGQFFISRQLSDLTHFYVVEICPMLDDLLHPTSESIPRNSIFVSYARREQSSSLLPAENDPNIILVGSDTSNVSY